MPLGFGGAGPHRWRVEAPGLTRIRLGLTVAGLILWGYGAHADIEWLRWSGIVLFAMTVILGFWGRRNAGTSSHRDEP